MARPINLHLPLRYLLPFTVEVSLTGFKSLKASGSSKRKAQMKAATEFLIREKVWAEDEWS